jgi:hypothetical protein
MLVRHTLAPKWSNKLATWEVPLHAARPWRQAWLHVANAPSHQMEDWFACASIYVNQTRVQLITPRFLAFLGVSSSSGIISLPLPPCLGQPFTTLVFEAMFRQEMPDVRLVLEGAKFSLESAQLSLKSPPLPYYTMCHEVLLNTDHKIIVECKQGTPKCAKIKGFSLHFGHSLPFAPFEDLAVYLMVDGKRSVENPDVERKRLTNQSSPADWFLKRRDEYGICFAEIVDGRAQPEPSLYGVELTPDQKLEICIVARRCLSASLMLLTDAHAFWMVDAEAKILQQPIVKYAPFAPIEPHIARHSFSRSESFEWPSASPTSPAAPQPPPRLTHARTPSPTEAQGAPPPPSRTQSRSPPSRSLSPSRTAPIAPNPFIVKWGEFWPTDEATAKQFVQECNNMVVLLQKNKAPATDVRQASDRATYMSTIFNLNREIGGTGGFGTIRCLSLPVMSADATPNTIARGVIVDAHQAAPFQELRKEFQGLFDQGYNNVVITSLATSATSDPARLRW